MKIILKHYIIPVLCLLAGLTGYAFQGPVLENGELRVSVTDKGGITFTDKAHDVVWGTDFPGWVEVRHDGKKKKIPLTGSHVQASKQGQTLQISFNGLKGLGLDEPEFLMQVQLTLENDYLELEIEQLRTSYPLLSIEYPAHLFSVPSGLEDSYIVAPHLQGIMIPSRYDTGFMRMGQNVWKNIADVEKWWTLESGNLNMPWFGAAQGKSAVMAYVETSSDCVLHMIGNKLVTPEGKAVSNRQGQHQGERISSHTPIWLASLRKFSYPRKMRIELVENGYVGMAKRYKEYAKASGRFVTLKEKIEKNPEYEKIVGAPDIKVYCFTNRKNEVALRSWSEPVLNGYSKVNTSFEQVATMANDLKELGIEKCMLLLAGWNRMGYDREHVDMWPPARDAGGIAGLRKAAETVKENGYLFALHDNYDDFYPDAPTFDEKYILKNEDQSLHLGGTWDGGVTYITRPSQRLELLNRNMALIQKDIPLNAYYFDVITNTSHYECYDSLQMMTRKEDLGYRLKLLQNITDRGLVIGGERGTDWALKEVAFCEGLSGGGTGYHRGVTYRTGITIPLFYLVYHESVVGYWQHGTPMGREDHSNHVLSDLLNAQPSSWSVEYDQWEDLKPRIKETYELLSPLHQRTAHEAMVDHQILSKDLKVQHTTFSDGTKVWVNYGLRTHSVENFKLPPKGFRIQYKDKQTISGSFATSIKYN